MIPNGAWWSSNVSTSRTALPCREASWTTASQVEHAAVREMREETGLDVELLGVLGVYSRPDRDPRRHTMSVVFVGRPRDAAALKAGDDAARGGLLSSGQAAAAHLFRPCPASWRTSAAWLAGERTLAPVEPGQGRMTDGLP